MPKAMGSPTWLNIGGEGLKELNPV
jgi:hypothetical protein